MSFIVVADGRPGGDNQHLSPEQNVVCVCISCHKSFLKVCKADDISVLAGQLAFTRLELADVGIRITSLLLELEEVGCLVQCALGELHGPQDCCPVFVQVLS